MFTPLPDGHFQPSRIDEQQAAMPPGPSKTAEMLLLMTIASGILGMAKCVVDAATTNH